MSRLFKCDRCGAIYNQKDVENMGNSYDIASYKPGKAGDGITWDGHIDLCPSCQEALRAFLIEYKEETK